MPTFNDRSLHRLTTCDDRLQRVFLEVIKIINCTVLEGYRTPERSPDGKTKITHGKHSLTPSQAVDVAPWPIPPQWDKRPYDHFAGVVRGVARQMHVPIVWGGRWDGDWYHIDQPYSDLVHYELIGGRDG